jgi:hypothetical protein
MPSEATQNQTFITQAQKMMRGELPPLPLATLLGFNLTFIEPGRTCRA